MANKGPLSGIQPFHLADASCSHVLVRSGLTVGMAELDATKTRGLAHGSTLSLTAVWTCADLLFHLMASRCAWARLCDARLPLWAAPSEYSLPTTAPRIDVARS